MRKSEEKKKKIIKVNRIKTLALRSKIKQLLKTNDNSAYLQHLIQNAYSRHPEVLVGWIKNICKELGRSVSEQKRHLWSVIKIQDRVHGSKLYDSNGQVLRYSTWENLDRVTWRM